MVTVSSVILLSFAIFEVIDAQSDDIVWTRPECREVHDNISYMCFLVSRRFYSSALSLGYC